MTIKADPLTMYIANRRDSSKFNGCSPLLLLNGLIGMKPAIAYLPYTYRCTQLAKFGSYERSAG